MKYKSKKEIFETYAKVYPHNENPTPKELEELEKYLTENIPYSIGDVFGIMEGYVYEYTEDNNVYEGDSLEELCYGIAIGRNVFNRKNKYNWIVSFNINNEIHKWYIWEFEGLLDCVSRFNCEVIGYLSDSQKVLVDIARELYDGVHD